MEGSFGARYNARMVYKCGRCEAVAIVVGDEAFCPNCDQSAIRRAIDRQHNAGNVTSPAGIGYSHAWLLEYDAVVDIRQRQPPDPDAFKLVMRISWNYNKQEHGIERTLDSGTLTINDALYDLVGTVISRFPLPPVQEQTSAHHSG